MSLEKKKRSMVCKKGLAGLLSISVMAGGVQISSALSSDDGAPNTTLSYAENEKGYNMSLYNPTEEVQQEWKRSFENFKLYMEGMGYSDIEEGYENNDMIYVSQESTGDEEIPVYMEGSGDPFEIPRHTELYDGKGGEYYLWHLCKGNLVEQSKEEDADSVEEKYFWVRTEEKIQLESNQEISPENENFGHPTDIQEEQVTGETTVEDIEKQEANIKEGTENEGIEWEKKSLSVDMLDKSAEKEADVKSEIQANEITVSSYEQLKSIIEGATSDITVRVSDSIDMTSGKITIPAGRCITISGGGQINRVSGKLDTIFLVSGKGTTLVLENITLEGNDISTSYPAVLVEKDADFYMKEGVVLRRFNRGGDADGVAVRVDYGGRFYMEGGIIEECRSGWGTAVNVRYYGYFEMSGGKIWHNLSDNEAAVDLYDGLGGSYVITGGEIIENYNQLPYYGAGIINGRDATTYLGSVYAGTFTIDELHKILQDGELNGGQLIKNYSYVGGNAKICDNYVGTGVSWLSKTWQDHKSAVEASAKKRENSMVYFASSYKGRDIIAPLGADSEIHISEGFPYVDHTSSGINNNGLGQDLASYNFARIVNEEGKRDLRGLKSDVYTKNASQIMANKNDYRGSGECTSWIPGADGFLYWISDVPGEMFNTTTVKLVDQNGREIPYTGGAAITTSTNASSAPAGSNNAYAVNENTIAFENGIWDANTVAEKTFYAPDLSEKGYMFSGKYSIDKGNETTGNMLKISDYKTAHEITFYYNAEYYNVQYDANHGISEKESDAVKPGESLVLPNATRDNYEFLGWYTEATGGEKIGSAGDTYTPEMDNITLYAQWAEKFSVMYDLNGGQGGLPITKSYIEGEEVTVATAKDIIPPDGKVFDYWQIDAEVSVGGIPKVNLYPGDVFVMPAKSLSIKAIWKNDSFDITFEGTEEGQETTIKVLNKAGEVSTKDLPNILFNGKPGTVEQLAGLTYSFEQYTRKKVDGQYVYDWSGIVLGENDEGVDKLPIVLNKPTGNDTKIAVSSRMGRSGIVKLTLSYGEGGKPASCVLIVPGDVDLNGSIRYSDVEMILEYINDNILLDSYPYQKMMCDMNSDVITLTPRITGQDRELLEAILGN